MTEPAIGDLSRAKTLAQLTKAWRRLRSVLHPDRGGSVVAFDQARKLHDKIYEELRRPVACTRCRASGKIEVGRGFKVRKTRCPVCDGRGSVPRKA